MTGLRLDFQRCTPPFHLAGTALLSLAVAVAILTGVYYYRLSTDSQALQDSLEKFQQAADVGQVKGPQPEMPGDARQAGEVLRQLTLPWDALFHAVESSTTPRVTLLGMEPDLEKHVVTISCEARDIASMLSFMKRLEARPEFGAVYLQRHQIQLRDPQRPVRFSLIAFWRAAA